MGRLDGAVSLVRRCLSEEILPRLSAALLAVAAWGIQAQLPTQMGGGEFEVQNFVTRERRDDGRVGCGGFSGHKL